MRGRSAFAIYGVLSLVLGWLVAGVHPDVLAPSPGEVVRYRIDGRAGPLAVGGGAAWVIAPDDGWGVLWRIDENTGAATRLAPTRGSSWPTFGEGYAWAPCAGTTQNPCGGPLVLKLDPRTGEVLDRIAVPGTGRISTGLGAVWVPGDALSSIDVATGDVQRYGGGQLSWVEASDDALWAGTDTLIDELDHRDGSVLRAFQVSDPCLFDVASDAIFAETCRPIPDTTGSHVYLLVRIDAASGAMQQRSIAIPSSMVEVAGRLWLARYSTEGGRPAAVLESFDPRTLGPTGEQMTVPLAASDRSGPGSIATEGIFLASDGSSLWFNDPIGDEVVRVGIPT